MQYLLTEEEFKTSIPRDAIGPFLKAVADYYARKNNHLMHCIQTTGRMDMGLECAPLDAAVARHRKEWTEVPPKPEDFFK